MYVTVGDIHYARCLQPVYARGPVCKTRELNTLENIVVEIEYPGCLKTEPAAGRLVENARNLRSPDPSVGDVENASALDALDIGMGDVEDAGRLQTPDITARFVEDARELFPADGSRIAVMGAHRPTCV